MRTHSRTGRRRRFSAGLLAPLSAAILTLVASSTLTLLGQNADPSSRAPGQLAPIRPVFAAGQEHLDQLTAGVDYLAGYVTLLFRDSAGITTPAAAQAAIAAMALNDPTIAATTIESVVSLFDTSPGVPNRDFRRSIGMDRIFLVDVPDTTDLPALINAFADEDGVESAEVQPILHPQAALYPDDPEFDASQQWNHYEMDSPLAWGEHTTGDAAVTIAFLDTGVHYAHPDLAENMWQNPGEDLDGDGVLEWNGSSWIFDPDDENGVDDDGNGKVDDFVGWNFELASWNNDVFNTGDEHGTLVAGTAAARGNNGQGVAGTCWNCSIMALRMGGPPAWAIDYATLEGADVLNISVAGLGDSSTHMAIQNAVNQGVVVVAAAGNVPESGATIAYPAAFDEVIAVTGSWENNERAGGSDPTVGSAWGTKADVAAPVETWSTKNWGLYGYTGGTSIAAPMVSGIVGLMKSQDPTLRRLNPDGTPNPEASAAPDRIVSALRGSAFDHPIIVSAGQEDAYIGTGVVNAKDALTYTSFPVAKFDPFLDDQRFSRQSRVQLRGTANWEGTGMYQVEYAPGTYPAPQDWELIALSTTPVVDGTLAEFYGSTLQGSPDGIYSFRVLSTDTSNKNALDETRMILGQQHVLYATGAIGPSTTLADLDSDGALEIVAGSTDGSVYAWELDGAPLPGWPQAAGGQVLSSPAVGDLDNDGDVEIVASAGNTVQAWHHDGTPLPGWPKTVPGLNFGSSPVLGDLDGDQYMEVGFASRGTSGSTLYVWNPDGSDAPGWPVQTTELMDITPAFGDVTGDGHGNLVIPDRGGNLNVWNEDGTPLAGWPIATGLVGKAPAVLVNLDGDGEMEIVVGLSGGAGNLRAYDGDGTLLPGWPVTVTGDVNSPPAVGDLDGDGALEIVVGTTGQSVEAFELDGTPLAGWPVTGLVGGFSSSPVMADLDDDGRLEVVIGAKDASHTVYAFEDDGTNVPGWPQATAENYTSGITSTASFGDADADGDLELFLGTGNLVYVWFLNQPTNLQLFAWPTYQHDVRNSGQYGNHCGYIQDQQCGVALASRCLDGTLVPQCGVCGCSTSQPICLGSGYCTGGGGGGCSRPPCELE